VQRLAAEPGWSGNLVWADHSEEGHLMVVQPLAVPAAVPWAVVVQLPVAPAELATQRMARPQVCTA